MADHLGIVIKNESDSFAQVVTDRQGACGGCQSTPHGCRSCLANAKMESRVANPLGARPGDLVRVHLSSANLFTGAAIIYLMPVLGLLFGALTGVWISAAYQLDEVSASIAGALAGLAVGFTGVIFLDRHPRVRRKIIPTITTIVTPKVGMPLGKQAPCCD